MKNVKDIRDEFFDNGKLSPKSIKDLIWHIENDDAPHLAITLVTDAKLMKLVPYIAKHLDSEDDFIREIAVGCVVGRLKLVEYGEKALGMAQGDPDDGPRALAISSLGSVINKADPILGKQIAVFLCDVMLNAEYDEIDKKFAFDSILEAMNVPVPQQLTMPYDENHDLVKQFKEKYHVYGH